jgi:hypothetical protein
VENREPDLTGNSPDDAFVRVRRLIAAGLPGPTTLKTDAMEVTMRVLVRAFGLGILLTICHASTVSADPILVRDGRLVFASARLDPESSVPDVGTPSAPFATFTGLASQSAADGLSSAQAVTTQRSALSSRLFSASGTVDSSARGNGNGEFFNASATGSSLFDIEFDLPVPHVFSLTGLIGVESIDEFPGAGGFGEVDVLLTSQLLSGEVIVLSDGLRGVGSRQLDARGILPTGRSRLQVEAFTESVSAGVFTRHTPSFDVAFALTPTPEPGSLFLFGGGLLALARRRLMLR